MNTFIRQKVTESLKTTEKSIFKKIKKYNISSYDRQSTPNCSYTALTATCRGPGTQRRQSSAE